MQIGQKTKSCATEADAVKFIDDQLQEAVGRGLFDPVAAAAYRTPRASLLVGVSYSVSRRRWLAERGTSTKPRPQGLPSFIRQFSSQQDAELCIFNAYQEELRLEAAAASSSGAGQHDDASSQQQRRLRPRDLMSLLPQHVDQALQRARSAAETAATEELSPEELRAEGASTEEVEVQRRFRSYDRRFAWQSVLQPGIRGQPVPQLEHLLRGLSRQEAAAWLRHLMIEGHPWLRWHLDHQPPLALS